MTSEEQRQRIRLRRDDQQWELDRAIRDTGRTFHFQGSGRGNLPESVKMHAMISKQLGKRARRLEQLAASENAAGHPVTALEFYFEASTEYARAQHPIFVNNAEKRYLHESSLRCYREVMRLAPYEIEHLDIPWDDTVVSGYLHLAPVDEPAPLVFFVPGCDMTKEIVPHPLYNWAAQRGMHLFSFDGPGQGESNLRGTRLTVDNYEDAASTALSTLLARSEIENSRVGLFGNSFGSYWAARMAASDDRYAATVLCWASICDKYYLFEEESPRYKQLFAYLTQSESEVELDRFIAEMRLDDVLPGISSPTLLTVGEYDPRSPIEEIYELFDMIEAPAELWVHADQHHMTGLRGGGAQGSWSRDSFSTSLDWLADRFAKVSFTRAGEVRYLEPSGPGPYDEGAAVKRRWFE